jgi:hypothetical protein
VNRMSELAHPDQNLASRLMRYLALARAAFVMLPNVNFFNDSETVLPSREAVARSLEEADKLLWLDTETEIAQEESRLRHCAWSGYRLDGSCYIVTASCGRRLNDGRCSRIYDYPVCTALLKALRPDDAGDRVAGY